MNLSDLQTNKLLKALLREGFMYPKINQYIEIFLYYDSKIKSGIKKSLAITWTADNFRLSEVTIYTIIKRITALQEQL
jgi:hypothetical protein